MAVEPYCQCVFLDGPLDGRVRDVPRSADFWNTVDGAAASGQRHVTYVLRTVVLGRAMYRVGTLGMAPLDPPAAERLIRRTGPAPYTHA